jgi:ABC-type amino acid transport substrate-binding protein
VPSGKYLKEQGAPYRKAIWKMKNHLSNIAVSVISSIVVVSVFNLFIATHHQTTAAPKTQSQYSIIRSSGVLRAAYAVGAPLLTIDPNTKEKSGIFYELVNEAASRIGLKVNWTVEVGYGEMIQGLNSNRYDIVGSGVWINSARGKDADFTIPAYFDAVFPYVKNSDTRFSKDISTFNSPEFTISTMDGELGASIAKADFPKARTLELPQNADFTQLILNVISGKADVVFLAAGPARAYQSVHPGQIRAVDPNKPVRIFANAIMLPSGQYELKQALDFSLREMLNDGTVEKILQKYEKIPGSFLRVAPPYQMEWSPK